MIYVTHYVFVPAFQRWTGQPYLVGYLIGWGTNMTLVFAASLIAYKVEGNPLTWQAFSKRYWLDHMRAADWLWTLIVLLVVLGTYFSLSLTTGWLARFPLFAPHHSFPIDMVTGILKPGYLFGMHLDGKWWVVIAYFIFWVFNILGEEFFYRGWLLPRQELAFGRFAWLVNGLMFTFQHWLQPWNFLCILPGALFAVFVVQGRRNTWIMIIQHGLMNVSLLVYIILGAAGWV